MLISKLILDFLLSIINIISFFIKKSIQTLARVPSFILLAAIALGIFFYHNNENFKKFIKELFTKGITSVHFLLTVIVDQIKDFYVLFEELVATLKPTLVTSFELIGYITMEYHLLMALVEDLEKKRPK